MLQKLAFTVLAVIISWVGIPSVSAQNYALVWEDQFNGNTLDSSKWNIEQKIGIWNTGANREFQHYKKENVAVGDDGNGNNCLILTAKEESYNGYHYTSGKVTTKGKFAFRRGKLEASIKIPNLANGLWPAFWTLGYTPVGWPDCGEIDVLEMGHASGIAMGKPNSYIGAHLFWGPYPRDYGKEFVAPNDLSTGFYKHTAVWTETTISVYFNDSPTPYFSMGITGDDTEEFRNFQQYIILNLAVGGSVPGIYNRNEITANFPASMYIDWVKVYQETEDHSAEELQLYGLFGIFQDEAPADMGMDLGFDMFENYNGVTPKTGEAPKAGNHVLAYNVTANQPFEIKLSAGLNRNMLNYNKGSVQLQLKTNIEGSIHLGIADIHGKEKLITINNNSTQKIERDETWQMVYIPIEELDGEVDLSALKEVLILKGNPTSDGYLAIDEVYYSENVPVGGVYGIYTNNPAITDKFAINNVSGHLYNWSNTVSFNSAFPAYEGVDVLSFRSSGAAAWWGFGIFSSTPLNFENYANGYLNFALRTLSTQTFNVNINGANNTEGKAEFNTQKESYGFKRDGKWHRISIPLADLVAQGLDLSACGNIFTMTGSTIADIAIDDIYLSETVTPIDNPNICYPVSFTISPKNRKIKADKTQKFTASATDQFDNPTDAYVTWFTDGGTIDATGLYTPDEVGVYNVWATLGELTENTTVIVENSTNIPLTNNSDLKIEFLYKTRQLNISGLESNSRIMVADLTGKTIFSLIAIHDEYQIDMSGYRPAVYIINVITSKGVSTLKIMN